MNGNSTWATGGGGQARFWRFDVDRGLIVYRDAFGQLRSHQLTTQIDRIIVEYLDMRFAKQPAQPEPLQRGEVASEVLRRTGKCVSLRTITRHVDALRKDLLGCIAPTKSGCEGGYILCMAIQDGGSR